jgi:uncharacterized membrane protein
MFDAAGGADRELFAARLSPHRSLGARQVRIVLIVFGLGAFVSSLPFLFLGAWPIAGFMGLDILALWFAFRINARDARAYEEISVTPVELALARVSARGKRREWRFNPLWVRLERKVDEDFGLLRLDLRHRGQTLELASCLGPPEKAEFADSLALALAEARRGPRYSAE